MNPSPLITMQSIDLPGLNRWQVSPEIAEKNSKACIIQEFFLEFLVVVTSNLN